MIYLYLLLAYLIPQPLIVSWLLYHECRNPTDPLEGTQLLDRILLTAMHWPLRASYLLLGRFLAMWRPLFFYVVGLGTKHNPRPVLVEAYDTEKHGLTYIKFATVEEAKTQAIPRHFRDVVIRVCDQGIYNKTLFQYRNQQWEPVEE